MQLLPDDPGCFSRLNVCKNVFIIVCNNFFSSYTMPIFFNKCKALKYLPIGVYLSSLPFAIKALH